MAYNTTKTSTEAKTAFKKYMQQQSAGYNAYLQSNASPQLSNATQTINALIGALNPGALPSGTATEVANVLRTTANILNQTGIDYTNMSKDDIASVIKTTIGVFLTRDVFSDGKWVTYLSKLNSELLGGIFNIDSPLVKTVVGKLTNTAAKAVTGILTKDEAQRAANECRDLQDSIADGTVGNNLDTVTEELDEFDREEIQDGISVEQATGGQMKHESRVPDKAPEFKWGFYDKAEGSLIVEIDAYLSDDITARSSVATFPLEKGSYKAYNKVNEGRTGTAVVARMAENTDIQAFHDKLEELRVSPKMFTLVSPNVVLNNMTVEGFNFKRDNRTSCNELLIVSITVREIQDTSKAKAFSTESAADASNVTPTNNGSVGAKQKTGKGKTQGDGSYDHPYDPDIEEENGNTGVEPSGNNQKQIKGETETPLQKIFSKVEKQKEVCYKNALDYVNERRGVTQRIDRLERDTGGMQRFHNSMREYLADNFPKSQLELFTTYTEIQNWTGGSLLMR